MEPALLPTQFTPLLSLTGGILIGISAVLLMSLHGRIAGMTGLLFGVLPPLPSDWQWRAAFLAGAIIAPMLYIWSGNPIEFGVPISMASLIGGGLIVGIGVTYGGGCTSGHGVCGMARLSTRSFVATVTFMIVAFVTVYFVRHVF